jgi:hypothetical protein
MCDGPTDDGDDWQDLDEASIGGTVSENQQEPPVYPTITCGRCYAVTEHVMDVMEKLDKAIVANQKDFLRRGYNYENLYQKLKVSDAVQQKRMFIELDKFLTPVRSLVCNEGILRFLCECAGFDAGEISMVLASPEIFSKNVAPYDLSVPEFCTLVHLGWHETDKVELRFQTKVGLYSNEPLEFKGFALFNVCGEEVKITIGRIEHLADDLHVDFSLPFMTVGLHVKPRVPIMQDQQIHIQPNTKICVAQDFEFQFLFDISVKRDNEWKAIRCGKLGACGRACIVDRCYVKHYAGDN